MSKNNFERGYFFMLRKKTPQEIEGTLSEEDEDDEVKDGMPALEPLVNVKYVFDTWEQVWSAQYQQHYYYNRYSLCFVSFLT